MSRKHLIIRLATETSLSQKEIERASSQFDDDIIFENFILSVVRSGLTIPEWFRILRLRLVDD